MNMTVILHDNHIYGLTKMQVSPTSPKGLKSNTTPHGAYLQPLNPLTVTLGIENVSFVAQAVDWIPDILYDIISAAYQHEGFSFVRVLQRCPEFLPDFFDPYLQDPERVHLMIHEDGLQLEPSLSRIYRHQETHDPSDIHRARELASMEERIPVGIFYRDTSVPCYETLRDYGRPAAAETVKTGLEGEFDKFTVWPRD